MKNKKNIINEILSEFDDILINKFFLNEDEDDFKELDINDNPAFRSQQKVKSDYLGKKGKFEKQQRELQRTGGKDDISYFDFGGLAKIPYTTDGTLHYIDEANTGKILGLSKSDKYGFYEEIFINDYDAYVRRYYPVNDWDDWNFLIKNKIPYAITNKNGDTFHLALKMIDPVYSVTELDNPSNKGRGWAITYPGLKSMGLNEGGTGYYKTDGTRQVPYNILAPVIPGDLGTWDLDTRTGFDKFMDSTVGTISQIVVAMVVTFLTRNLAIGQIVAEGIVATRAIQVRLLMASITAELITNVPVAIYQFNRPGYEQAGLLSLAFCFLPLIQRFTPLNNILSDFSEKTCIDIASKVMSENLQNMTQAQIKNFMTKLTMEERVLFMRVMKNSDSVIDSMKSVEGKLIKEWESAKGPEVLVYKQQLEELIKRPETSTLKEIVIDLGVTLTYNNILSTVMDKYTKYKEKKMEEISKLTDETKEDIAKNIQKAQEEIKGMPAWVDYYAKSIPQIDMTKFTLTDAMVIDLVENGKLSESFKKELYNGAANKLDYILKETQKGEAEAKKIIDEELSLEIAQMAYTFLSDPETVKYVSQEKRDLIKKYFVDLLVYKPEWDKYFGGGEIITVKKDEKVSEIKPEPIETEKDVNIEAPVSAATPDQRTELGWVLEPDVFKFLKYKRDTVNYETAQVDENNEIKNYYRKITPESTVKINTTNDKNFDYKLDNGKYYYKGKGTMSTKYPNWVEATGNTLTSIKTKVNFQ